jgi:hypothetical protein
MCYRIDLIDNELWLSYYLIYIGELQDKQGKQPMLILTIMA